MQSTRLGNILHRTLLIIGVLFLFLENAVFAQQTAQVWFEPGEMDLALGAEGVLEVHVRDVQQLAGIELHIAFDPNVLTVVDADPGREGVQIQNGGFLTPEFVIRNEVLIEEGTLTYSVACGSPLEENVVSGAGVLAKIPFRAVSDGKTLVEMQSVLLANKSGEQIPVEEEVRPAVVNVGRPGSYPEVWVVIGLVAVLVVAGLVVVLWRAVRDAA